MNMLACTIITGCMANMHLYKKKLLHNNSIPMFESVIDITNDL